ncbi:hypothetical protein U9M48_023641 [Paspalum notatum var. saurae]|uniref:Retroviral polymerase SH3-like domain-containing protein n=1 Tax=Paspalum notatum var. saurae TaxID=547442 RepID=A0AAQ3TLY7_PASNO
MKATLSDFGLRFGKIPLLVDSTSAISVAKNPVLHSRTKHIDVRFHFLRDHYEKGDIDLVHIASENQLADIFTKPLEFGAFVRLRVNTACYIANRIFLRAFLGKTSYELRFCRQPSVKHLRAFGFRCFVLKKAGHLDKFVSHCLDGIFLGYASSSRAFRVWILEAKQVVETCEVSFDESMPCTTPTFEISGDDEEGTPIFEDEEDAVGVGDAGATAPAAAPAPSAMSFDDEGQPLPTASSSLPRQQAQAKAGPVEDAWEVTSEIVPSRQFQQDHPPHRMIGDIHQCVTRSSVNSLSFFSHSAYVATFEPRDVSHALSDPNWRTLRETMFGIYSSSDCRSSKALRVTSSIKPSTQGTYSRSFNMGDSRPMTTPMSTNTALDADEDGEAVDQKEFRGMIGSLLISHRQTVKRIFRYLKFTLELGLWYSSGSSLALRGFLDADHAGCRIDRKSTSSTCQLLGTFLVSWSSRKQASVDLSTTEAEYVVAANCCSQLLWMKATLSDFGLRFGKIPLLVDSTSAISVAKNPVLHSRTKHIDMRFHFLRDHYEKGDIDLIHVEGVDNALINREIESQWTGRIALLV